MKQIIVYKHKPASINNKNDNAKTAYQNSLREVANQQNAFIMDGDLIVDILWRQSNPADIDNIIKYTLDALKGICYNDDKSIIKLTISKEYSTNDQLTITIKSKFIISKFIKKIVFKTIIKPLLRYINSNYQDMLTAQIPKPKIEPIPKISPPKPINQNNDITTNLTQDIISALNSQKNKIDIVEFSIKGQKLILYPQISQNLSSKERTNTIKSIQESLINTLSNRDYLANFQIAFGSNASKNAKKIVINKI